MKSANNYFRCCPRCGGRLTVKRRYEMKRLVCRKCQFVFFQNSKPTVSAFIVNNRGQLLLVKRGIMPKFGYWDVFGGFLEDGEDLIKGLQREAKEELGVRLKAITYLGIYMDVYDFQYRVHTMNIIYQAQIASGRLQAMSDVSEYRWFSRNTIPWPRLAFPRWMKPALRDWLKLQK